MKKVLNYLVFGAVAIMFSAALASCQKESATASSETSEMHVFHVELDAAVADTKASYNSQVINFESGDALYVVLTQPTSATWSDATGTLIYDGNSFIGDIAYSGTYSGSDIITDAKDLSAAFLPKGYSAVNYLSATGATTATNAFYAGAKDAAVPHLVHLTASVSDETGEPKSPLLLFPENEVLSYTITANALSAGVHTVSVSNGNGTTISGEVTAKNNMPTIFAVAFPEDVMARTYTLGIPGYCDVPKSGRTLIAGIVANITVTPNAPLPGVFSVSSNQTVKFSKGNLQAFFANSGTSCTWRFAANQWDIIGDASANNSIDGDGFVSSAGAVDLFGWSTSATTLGIYSSETSSDYSGTFVDWGSNDNVQAGIGTGWRTLSSTEWEYLCNGRTSVAKRYCMATVNNVMGVVIFPDSFSHPSGVVGISSPNIDDAAFTTNNWSGTDWGQMEAAGAVFLPTAGHRNVTTVNGVGIDGLYWSSTSNGDESAFGLGFINYDMKTNKSSNRHIGRSVRLVQNQ
jgi:hypothetical protein